MATLRMGNATGAEVRIASIFNLLVSIVRPRTLTPCNPFILALQPMCSLMEVAT